MDSQASQILHYLQHHPAGITPRQALFQFGCMRLAARIAELRAAGNVIDMTREGKKRYARYRLVPKPQLELFR